ncbi:MAG: RDD family protein [Firmicutes bacterium]|nr:RDD family protein [Bacillota bacterium]
MFNCIIWNERRDFMDREYICPHCKSKIHIDCNYCPVCGKDMKELEERNLRDLEGLINIYPRASLSKRILAALIDWGISIVGMLPGVLILVIGILRTGMYNNYYSHNYYAHSYNFPGFFILGVLLIILGFLWRTIYVFIKDGFTNGQSIGKRALGLMVIDLKDNTPCTKGESAIRRLIMVLLNFVPIIGWLVEPILIIANEKGRRLGDMAASTQVINIEYYKTNI